MGTATQARGYPPARGEVRLFVEHSPESGAVFWRINGYRARLVIWTVEEWEKLDRHPKDAQYHPCGVWCALRMD